MWHAGGSKNKDNPLSSLFFQGVVIFVKQRVTKIQHAGGSKNKDNSLS